METSVGQGLVFSHILSSSPGILRAYAALFEAVISKKVVRTQHPLPRGWQAV